MKKTIFVLVAILFIVFGISVARDVNKSNQILKVKNIELQNNEVKLKKLETDFNKLNDTKAITDQQVKELEEQRLKLEQEKKDLEAALQAKAELKQQRGAVAYAAQAPVTGNCGDNFYKQYIYQKESSCNTGAVNSIGCRGIGQACPGDKLPCGNDFACQDAWFSNYAIQRYGSWEAAYNFWINNNWW